MHDAYSRRALFSFSFPFSFSCLLSFDEAQGPAYVNFAVITRLGPNSLVLRHDSSALRTAFCVRSSEPSAAGFPTRFAALGHRRNKQPPSRALRPSRRTPLAVGNSSLEEHRCKDWSPWQRRLGGGAPALGSRSGGSGALSLAQAGRNDRPSGRASPCVEAGHNDCRSSRPSRRAGRDKLNLACRWALVLLGLQG
jgi:hypothetical protein